MKNTIKKIPKNSMFWAENINYTESMENETFIVDNVYSVYNNGEVIQYEHDQKKYHNARRWLRNN